MLTFTAKLTVKAGQEREFERIMCIAVPKVREEPGNHAYIFHRSPHDPRVFMFYEEYADQAALDAHLESPHIKALLPRVDALCAAFPQITTWERVD